MTLITTPVSAIARHAMAAVLAGLIALVAASAATAQDNASADVAQDVVAASATETILASGGFARKRKGTSGGWEIVQRDDATVLRLLDDFRTGRGPDIKIFLSPTAFASTNGQNATDGSLLLGQLDSNRGAAELTIPADVDLAQFDSVLVHCEEFSVLFGGSPLRLAE